MTAVFLFAKSAFVSCGFIPALMFMTIGSKAKKFEFHAASLPALSNRIPISQKSAMERRERNGTVSVITS
jgi:hypothetical protein